MIYKQKTCITGLCRAEGGLLIKEMFRPYLCTNFMSSYLEYVYCEYVMIKIRASKRPEFPTWYHFLRCFCRTEAQVSQCIQILQRVIDSDNYFPADKWRSVPKSSVGMYTKCLGILRENGLVQKINGHYSLSRDLLISLNKIINRWKELVNAVKRGEKISIM